MSEAKKCCFPEGIAAVKSDGEHELDPCVFEDVQIVRNVTVFVSRCARCGRISVSWQRQSDSEDVDPEDYYPEAAE